MPGELSPKGMLKMRPANEYTRGRLRRFYQECRKRGLKIYGTLHTEEIDLNRALIPGEGGFDAETWAEITGRMERASMLLADSPHVKFLEQYSIMGAELFKKKNFEQTPYFQNAVDCIRYTGGYFQQRTVAGLLTQAKLFTTLFERIRQNNSTEVPYPAPHAHSEAGSLPVVRKTWTPDTVHIDDGLHRLSAAFVLGRPRAKAVVLTPPIPTALQSLVGKVSQTFGKRELYELHQPIDSVEFDSSWPVLRNCRDRMEMMMKFLSDRSLLKPDLSAVDLACSYGWFVSEFTKRGGQVAGVDSNPAALKIGEIAYGLNADCLRHQELMKFLSHCNQRFDIVLLLSVLQDYLPKSDFDSAEEVLQKVDRITEHVLFFDTGQAHERWFRARLPEWDNDYIVRFIRHHTSFNHVVPLGTDSDNVGGFRGNFGRTLFACFRG